MLSDLSKMYAVQAWRAPSTENIVVVPELMEEFARILDTVLCQPWLGNATTRELIEEIKTRIEMDGNLDHRTVDE